MTDPLEQAKAMAERLERKAKYTDQTFCNSSLGETYRDGAALMRQLIAQIEGVR
jgi:hypothetical protein